MKIRGLVFLSLFFIAGSALESSAQGKFREFRLPDVPSGLKSPEERATYLSVRYWDYFDFTDTSLIACPEITEQAFVNFIGILPYSSEAQAAVDTLYSRAMAEKKMFSHFVELGEKYLYESVSPMYDEELYIIVLRALVENPDLPDIEKERPRFLMEMALKNRPGDVAADFSFVCRDGQERRLSEICSDYILIYFNDPDCRDCRRVKELLSASETINGLLAGGRLTLLSVCVGGKTASWENSVCPGSWIDGCDPDRGITSEKLYDLKALPAIYLLDTGKCVLLKNTSVQQVETFLETVFNAVVSKRKRTGMSRD